MNFFKMKKLILTVLFIFLIGGHGFAGEHPVKIGATVSLEGKFKAPSDMVRQAYLLWAKQVNARGGILGRPVELVLYDDKSSPDLARFYYKKLIEADRVDLTFSPYGTPLTLAASEVTEAHEYVMLACAASGGQIWERGYKYVFGVYALADRYFIGFVDLMARNNLESLGIIFEKSPFNLSVAVGAREWADRMGMRVKYFKGFQDPASEFPVLLKEVAQQNVQCLVFSAYPNECYRFIGLMKEGGYRPGALAFTIAPVLPEFYQRVGSFADGVFGPSQWEADERIPFPGTVKFIEDFRAFTGKAPSYHAGSAYSACQLIERAINHFNEIDHKKLREHIVSLDTVTVIGRFKVDHRGSQIGHNPILIQWQHGRKEIVWPPQMKTSEPIFNVPK